MTRVRRVEVRVASGTTSPEFDKKTMRCKQNGGWVCEHRWPEIRAMVKFRSLTNGNDIGYVYKVHNLIAFVRMGAGYFAANNNDQERR